MSRLLAVDPGKQFGVCIYSNNKYASSFSGDISKLYTVADLLEYAKNWLPIHRVATEYGGWQSKAVSHGIGYSLGVILGAFQVVHLKQLRFRPTEWRRILFDTGSGGKLDSIAYATMLVDKPIQDHNEAEAICIAEAAVLSGKL